jgi:protease-4
MIVATGLAILLIVVVVKSSISSALQNGEEESSVVKSNSVLKLTLDGPIRERTKENPFKELGGGSAFGGADEEGLNDMTARLRQAAKDEKVKGLYLEFKSLQAGFATIEELRNALLDFKKSGKFIYAYSEAYSQKDYYLASTASTVFLNPQGAMDWRGLSMSLMFFKHSFEKLDIDMQIFRHGKFKSAIEPFMLDKMSEANRQQSETYLNALWGSMITGIAKERKMQANELNELANGLKIKFPEDAKGKFVDQLAYEDEVMTQIKKKIGLKEADKLKFVDFNAYQIKASGPAKADRVAVIYANGSIGDGEGSDDEIGSDRLAKAIREARLDEKVKAIVLRVNSPGGSALASDVIWREVQLARKSKPTVVSMGDLAASGGYYISCAADRIFAQPNTLTGSIGVFGLIPNIQKMLETKLGITIDTVNTNKFSDIGALRPLTATEQNYVQSSVERVYETFIGRVAEGRKMTTSQVDSIGQGRVWAGSDAVKIGLVDELGGLQDAILYAVQKAKLKEYKVIELPKQKGPFDGILGKKEADVESALIRSKLGPMYNYFMQVQEIVKMKGIQARLPYSVTIN